MVSRLPVSLGRGVRVTGSEQEAVLWAKPFDRRGHLEAKANTPIWWTRGAMKRVLLPWDNIVVLAYPSFVEDTSLFLDRSGCRMSMLGSVPEG